VTRKQQVAPEIVKTADGRKLRVDVAGDPDGLPVLLLHGTPGSRNGPRPRGIVLHRMGIWLISYDRPGYGESSRHAGRMVADVARDVAAIADEYGLGTFAVAGRSGGGPHALACAALLPGRVTRVAVLVSTAPADAPDLDWLAGMHEANRDARRRARECDGLFDDELRKWVSRLQDDPEALVRHLERGLPSPDHRVLGDRAVRNLIVRSYAEAFKSGSYGWLDDTRALWQDWGFSLSTIAAPVRLWHGAIDAFSPAGHTQWLAAQIPRATYEIQPKAGHFAAMEMLPQMLSWLVADKIDPPGPAQVPVAYVSTGSGRGFGG
jgi:pimeloyl-ACP methyl ester carboxylesterase